MTSIPTIAAKLTKAQREAIIHARLMSPMASRVVAAPDAWPQARKALVAKGLATEPWYALTDLGLSVRTHLEKEASK